VERTSISARGRDPRSAACRGDAVDLSGILGDPVGAGPVQLGGRRVAEEELAEELGLHGVEPRAGCGGLVRDRPERAPAARISWLPR
jgi:hypothetical protein